MPIRAILVPTDFSECASAALDEAVELAAPVGAIIHVLTVVPLPTFMPLRSGIALDSEATELVQRASRNALDELVAARRDRAAFGPPRLELGDPRSLIESTARALEVDLIVIGSHGRRGLARYLLGSVAEDVLRSAPCSVLVVRSKPGDHEDVAASPTARAGAGEAT
ncbi:MAG: universal stress protein [Kofleriaceae bacterium]